MKEEKFFLDALDKAAISIAILDFQLKIRWVNDIFEEWHQGEELIGKDFLAIATNPVLSQKAISLLKDSKENQQVFQNQDLQGRTIRTTINSLKTQRNAYVIMETDVTNLVKAHHYQKVFTSSMGHDTKGHLRDSINLIKELYQSHSEAPHLKEKLKDLLFYTEHAFDIVKNLNDWGKPLLGGESPIAFSYFNLAEHLYEVKNHFALLLQHHKISLKTNFPEHLSFRAEPEMFCTVLRNLIGNSLDAITTQQKEFGKVGGYIEISAEKKENKIVIQVSDDGGGIPKKVVHALFSTVEEEFFSLGTMLCREFILAHKGNIFIDTPKTSYDTTITIIIPSKL